MTELINWANNPFGGKIGFPNKMYNLGKLSLTLFKQPIKLCSVVDDPQDIIWENTQTSDRGKKNVCASLSMFSGNIIVFLIFYGFMIYSIFRFKIGRRLI